MRFAWHQRIESAQFQMKTLFKMALLFGALESATLPPAEAQQPLSADSRLSGNVTIEAGSLPIGALLAKLPMAGKPEILADRAAREERVTVYAANQPLHRIMGGLSHLMNYGWTADETQPASRYTLARTRWAENYERRLWRETLARGAKPLFQLAEHLNIPRETAEKRWKAIFAEHTQEEPLLKQNLYYLGRDGPRTVIEILAAMTEDQKWTLLEDQRLILAGSALTERERAHARNLGVDQGKLLARIGKLAEGETPDSTVEWAEKLGVQLKVEEDPLTGRVVGFDYGAGTPANMAAGYFGHLPKSDDVLPVRGDPYHRRKDDGKPQFPDLEKQPFPAAFQAKRGQLSTWPDMMRELHRLLPYPLYADDYLAYPAARDRHGERHPGLPEHVPPFPSLKGMSLAQALDALCNHFHRLWWREGGSLYFRSRTWFIERQYEVPQPILDAIHSTLGVRGEIDAATLLSLASLTAKQLHGLDRVMGKVAGGDEDRETVFSYYGSQPRWGAHEFLNVFAALDSNRQKQVFSPQGLPLAGMNRRQRDALISMLAVEHGADALRNYPDLSLQIEQIKYPEMGGPTRVRILEVRARCWGGVGAARSNAEYAAGFDLACRLPRDPPADERASPIKDGRTSR